MSQTSRCSNRRWTSKPNTTHTPYTQTLTHMKGLRLGLMFKAIFSPAIVGRNLDRHFSFSSLAHDYVLLSFKIPSLFLGAECGKQRTFFSTGEREMHDRLNGRELLCQSVSRVNLIYRRKERREERERDEKERRGRKKESRAHDGPLISSREKICLHNEGAEGLEHVLPVAGTVVQRPAGKKREEEGRSRWLRGPRQPRQLSVAIRIRDRREEQSHLICVADTGSSDSRVRSAREGSFCLCNWSPDRSPSSRRRHPIPAVTLIID